MPVAGLASNGTQYLRRLSVTTLGEIGTKGLNGERFAVVTDRDAMVNANRRSARPAARAA